MTYLKNAFILFAALAVVTLSACSEDDCTAPDVSTNIIGTWTVTGGTGTVEFKTDGTLIDADSDLIGGEINGEVLDQKSYVATNDSLFLEAASSTSANSVSATLPIEGNECDKITISIIGIQGELLRQ